MPTALPRAERVPLIRDYVADGHNDVYIGKQLGVCAATVSRDRKAHNIPPGHDPARLRTTVHGTPGMWRRCSCTTCTSARNAQHKVYVQQMNTRSAASAPLSGHPWAPHEDDAVMNTEVPVSITAKKLGRTWRAVTQRRRKLRALANA